jgi:predicted enzyme related to lactoylglutathione lyase
VLRPSRADAAGPRRCTRLCSEPSPTSTSPTTSASGWETRSSASDPNGHRQGTPGPVTYYHDDDLKDLLGRLRETGASQQGEVRDVGGGKLVVTLTDPDGRVFGLSQEP